MKQESTAFTIQKQMVGSISSLQTHPSFFSEDKLASLNEMAEINYDTGGLIPCHKQFIDAVAETMEGSVLLAG